MSGDRNGQISEQLALAQSFLTPTLRKQLRHRLFHSLPRLRLTKPRSQLPSNYPPCHHPRSSYNPDSRTAPLRHPPARVRYLDVQIVPGVELGNFARPGGLTVPQKHSKDCFVCTSLEETLYWQREEAMGEDVEKRALSREAAEAVERDVPYQSVFGDVSKIIDAARESVTRSVNAAMTAAYWLVGRRIVEFEQSGEERAEYGAALLERLADDLTRRFGRGFSRQNLQNMRMFYLSYPLGQIRQTPSGKLALPPHRRIRQTSSGISEVASEQVTFADLITAFPLPWSAYVRLLSVKNENAREFYEAEALRGGWSVRQLDRQISSQFYERTALSKNKAAMLTKGGKTLPEDLVHPEEEIKDPFVLEFLDLKDEYSESDLEEALVHHLETFLMELGGDFCFMGRQRRLRIGGTWYKVDLLFFHRGLRCLVVIDLKIGSFTHADAGQMHLYLNYAREHWVLEGENPPIGLILCSEKDEALAQYALDGLPNKVMAAEYRIALPDEAVLAAELDRTRKAIELRGSASEVGVGEAL